jgi:hypothetical protein
MSDVWTPVKPEMPEEPQLRSPSKKLNGNYNRCAPGAALAPGVLLSKTNYILNANVFFLINVVI